MAQRHLQVLRIDDPCTVDWGRMDGDDRVRHCGVCERNVYDLTVLSSEEIDELLARYEGGGLCVQMLLRADGTVVVADEAKRCPEEVAGAAKRRDRRRLLVGAIGAAVGASAFATLARMAASWVEAVTAPAFPEHPPTPEKPAPVKQPKPAPVEAPIERHHLVGRMRIVRPPPDADGDRDE